MGDTQVQAKPRNWHSQQEILTLNRRVPAVVRFAARVRKDPTLGQFDAFHHEVHGGYRSWLASWPLFS